MNNSSQDIFRVSCEIFGSSYSFKSELPSEKLLIVYIIVLVFNAILIIPTILLNVVSIITILKSSHLSSKPCYFVILVQSVIDSAVGFFGIPSFLVYTLGKIGLHSNCGVLLLGCLTTIVMVNISTIVLLAMTLERYIAVLHPFAYKTTVTKRRILMCVCTASLLFFSVVTLSQTFRKLIAGWVIVQSTIFFFFIALAYTRIFLVVKKLTRFQNKIQDDHGHASEVHLTKTMLFFKDIKHAKSCFIVVLCYVVLHYMPVMVIIFFKHAMRVYVIVPEIYVTLFLLNSSINSVIFFWTKTMLRKDAVKFLKSLKLNLNDDLFCCLQLIHT